MFYDVGFYHYFTSNNATGTGSYFLTATLDAQISFEVKFLGHLIKFILQQEKRFLRLKFIFVVYSKIVHPSWEHFFLLCRPKIAWPDSTFYPHLRVPLRKGNYSLTLHEDAVLLSVSVWQSPQDYCPYSFVATKRYTISFQYFRMSLTLLACQRPLIRLLTMHPV